VVFHALCTGQVPEPIFGGLALDEINQRVYEQGRQRALSDVLQSEQHAYRGVLAAVEQAVPEDLFDGTRFAWTGGKPFVDWIEGNTYGHYAEHIAPMREMQQLRAKAQGVLAPARAFLLAHGRDIDRARYNFHFEHSISQEELLSVLAGYQNPDGGFTRLEVDIEAPVSNPFATELALVIMRWAGTPPDHPLLAKTVAYLEETQFEDGSWRFVPEVYQHGLAPWFQNWNWPNLNPTCTLAGLLRQLGAGSEQLHERVQILFDRLANPRDLTGTDFYGARPYAFFFQAEWNCPLADLYRWGVVWWLVHQHYANTELDATHFLEYAPMPDSAVARRLPALALSDQLDRLQADQQADGGWPTPYNPAWRGWITVNNLLTLRAYRRI
jgi:hypothetical protein